MNTSKLPKHRDYVFRGLTQSLCPVCREVVPAKILVRGKRVYFRKVCPTHGTREDFICSDVDFYDRVETSLPAKLPQRVYAEVDKGCPYDCGLCTEHEQHTCVAVIEITDNCNLTCPMCYADSRPGQKHKPLEDVKQAIDRLVAAEGRPEVVQLSGGEPTLHPDLLEMIRYAYSLPIDYLMINTNGLRLGQDPALLEAIAEYRDRVEIYFQLDALDDGAIARLRGQAGLLERKLNALDRIADSGLNVTLVSTLEGGLNDSAPADLLDYAKDKSWVTGLSFQPATYSGRHELAEQLERRITFPDVIKTIATDERNAYRVDDFFPLPCAHPNCHWISLAMRTSGQLLPLSQVIDAKANLDLLANGLSFTREKTSELAKQVMQRMSCGTGAGSGCCGNDLVSLGNDGSSPEQSVEDFLTLAAAESIGAKDLLRITITSFLDVYNFDLRRVMKCCTHHVLPSGHIIPFCAYNVLYRDGTASLPDLVQDSEDR